jgi:agmatinase
LGALAPLDELVSERPGTRLGPRAIRAASAVPGPHLEARIDPLRALRVVDYGDAGVLPADPVRSHAAIEATVADVVAAGTVPIVLGGDHSIAERDVRACAGIALRRAATASGGSGHAAARYPVQVA